VDVKGTHNRKLAKKKDFADWSIGKKPQENAGNSGPIGRQRQSPRLNSG